jgi:hydrogenase assembly chaperone HypC/HupF
MSEIAIANARKVNQDIKMLTVSARTGEVMEDWIDWIGGARHGASPAIRSARRRNRSHIMCLAIPAKVTELEGDDMAVVALEGIKKRISLALVDEIAVGDYVLVHVGYALHKAERGRGGTHASADGRGRCPSGGTRRDDRRFGHEICRRIPRQAILRKLPLQIGARRSGPDLHFMEFCGGHTHAIFRYGVQDLMPDNVAFVHGPGCPVCVLPVRRLDDAVELAERHGVILCTYGDMMRVPGTKQRSLIRAKADGADIRMVYSTLDALKIARDNPDRQVVFFAIGFRDDDAADRVAIKQAKKEGLGNFSVFCNHVLTPPAIAHILIHQMFGLAPGDRRVPRPLPCQRGDRIKAL